MPWLKLMDRKNRVRKHQQTRHDLFLKGICFTLVLNRTIFRNIIQKRSRSRPRESRLVITTTIIIIITIIGATTTWFPRYGFPTVVAVVDPYRSHRARGRRRHTRHTLLTISVRVVSLSLCVTVFRWSHTTVNRVHVLVERTRSCKVTLESRQRY